MHATTNSRPVIMTVNAAVALAVIWWIPLVKNIAILRQSTDDWHFVNGHIWTLSRVSASESALGKNRGCS
ncbi:hypothetical protein P692DRAFT_20840154, partial [Suillus brevipes Sb2]